MTTSACREAEVPPVLMPDYRTDVPHRRSFELWRKAGKDRNSLCAALRLSETATSLALPARSPAVAAGFKPYDWSICGPRR